MIDWIVKNNYMWRSKEVESMDDHKNKIEKLENDIANIKDVLDVQDEPEMDDDEDIEDDDRD